jgi:DNA-binding protein H-NS
MGASPFLAEKLAAPTAKGITSLDPFHSRVYRIVVIHPIFSLPILQRAKNNGRSRMNWRFVMKAANLKTMSIDALLDLRQRVDDAISSAGRALQDQLARLGLTTAPRRRSAMRGRKVAPKYRGPKGETWAGRGARPRWLTALVRDGHKVEEFAVDKEARAKARKKVRAKRKTQKRARR